MVLLDQGPVGGLDLGATGGGREPQHPVGIGNRGRERRPHGGGGRAATTPS